tara:strand:- start:103 stop:363 length:261 start_codon:yes stop_codon:yes gene_type:complete
MRLPPEIFEAIEFEEDPEALNELRDELWWSALTVQLGNSPTAATLRLFADVKGWTKSGGESGTAETTRIDPSEARSIFAAFLRSQE